MRQSERIHPLQHGFLNLEWLLDHELKVAERFRHFVSLALVSSAEGDVSPHSILGEMIRSSDVFFDLGGVGGILMIQTDAQGARQAVERYKRACEGSIDFRFAVGSYPDEQKNAASLLRIVYQRLKQARAGGPGEVVMAD